MAFLVVVQYIVVLVLETGVRVSFVRVPRVQRLVRCTHIVTPITMIEFTRGVQVAYKQMYYKVVLRSYSLRTQWLLTPQS